MCILLLLYPYFSKCFEFFFSDTPRLLTTFCPLAFFLRFYVIHVLAVTLLSCYNLSRVVSWACLDHSDSKIFPLFLSLQGLAEFNSKF